MGSTRLPGKVMQEISGAPMIGVLLQRLGGARLIDETVIATSVHPRDDVLAEFATHEDYQLFRGSEDDVLDRYYRAAVQVGANTVVRITGDCPLVDPRVVDEVVHRFNSQKVDYMANNLPATFPHGLDTEVLSFEALKRAWEGAVTVGEREHVTPFIRESGYFRCGNLTHHSDLSDERWTVDEISDLKVVRAIFEHFRPRRDFGWLEVLELKRERPDVFLANQHLSRNQERRSSASRFRR